MKMDLRLEAAALSELRDILNDDPHMHAPLPLWDMTERDVLVVEWVDGIKLNQVEAIRKAGHDMRCWRATCYRAF